MIKLIATDMDGTLLKNGAQSISAETIDLIKHYAKEYGVLFVAASGRQYPCLKHIFGSAAKYMAFICENGAVTFYHDELIDSRPMDRDTAVALSHDILSLDGCELLLSGKYDCYMIPKTQEYIDRVVEIVKDDHVILTSVDEMPEEFYKVAVCELSGVAKGHAPELLARWTEEKGVKGAISGRDWLDFMHPDVNKGTALTSLMEKLNIHPSESVAFGDNYNDLEMLDLVGKGYVMNNAVEDIKRRFNYHCDDVMTTVKELLEG